MPELPGRPDFWNISYPLLGALVYITLPIAVTSISIALYKRYRIWRLGKPTPYMGPWSERIIQSCKLAFLDIFGHGKFLRR